MITKEQAEAISEDRIKYYYKIRDLLIEPCDLSKEDQGLLFDDMGCVDFQNDAWKVTFEYTQRNDDRWMKRLFFVVEPEPGPCILG